jgi:hypothetical protein
VIGDGHWQLPEACQLSGNPQLPLGSLPTTSVDLGRCEGVMLWLLSRELGDLRAGLSVVLYCLALIRNHCLGQGGGGGGCSFIFF